MRNDTAGAFDVTGSGASTGKNVAVYAIPMPMPLRNPNPMNAPLGESARSVARSATAMIVTDQPNQSWGRYRFVTVTLIPPMMEMGDRERARPKRSTPDAVGDASLHAWKYTGR